MQEELEATPEPNVFLLTHFDKPTLEDFLKFSLVPGEKVIFLSSGGGATAVMSMIVHTINNNPEEYTIKIAELNCSSAFLLCLYSRCQIEEISSVFNDPVTHLWHSCQGMLLTYTRQELKEFNAADSRCFDMIKHVLTKKQIRKRERFVRWAYKCRVLRKFLNDDIYLTNEQMEELLGDRYTVIRER